MKKKKTDRKRDAVYVCVCEEVYYNMYKYACANIFISLCICIKTWTFIY